MSLNLPVREVAVTGCGEVAVECASASGVIQSFCAHASFAVWSQDDPIQKFRAAYA